MEETQALARLHHASVTLGALGDRGCPSILLRGRGHSLFIARSIYPMPAMQGKLVRTRRVGRDVPVPSYVPSSLRRCLAPYEHRAQAESCSLHPLYISSIQPFAQHTRFDLRGRLLLSENCSYRDER